jgi:hypothetical protein
VKALLARIGREPNAVLGVLTAGLSLAILFGLDITKEQYAGIGVFLGAVFFLIRWITTPWSEVVARRQPGQAVEAGPAAEVPEGTPVELVTGQPPAPNR